MRAVVALTLLLAACSSKSEEPGPTKFERDGCKAGDGNMCLRAARYYKTDDKAQLRKAQAYWELGCNAGNATCCGQLGTILEFGMLGEPDKMSALRYYSIACKGGDQQSCRALGIQQPDDEKDKPKFPWREALTPVCGKTKAMLGPLFDGFVMGEPMPAGMQERITEYEKKFKAHVDYRNDPGASNPLLEVRFDEKEAGLAPVLGAGWGKPDLAGPIWTNADAHLIAFMLYGNAASSWGIAWGPYHSVDDVIAPSDKDKLGFEPFPVVGGKLADLKAALGARLKQRDEDQWMWTPIGVGGGFDVHVVEKRGVIVELRTTNLFTHSPVVGDQMFAALATKWGKPSIKNGTQTWSLRGRRVTATKPAGGNFEIVIEKR